MSTRRRFIQLMPVGPLAGAALLVGCSDKVAAPATRPSQAPVPGAAPAAPAPVAPPTMPPATGLVSPSDLQARTLGYVPLTGQADASKYTSHAATQFCSNCALYAGKRGEASGPCPIFPGRLVSAQGWCSRWAKMA